MRPDVTTDGADAFSEAARKVVDCLSRHTPLSDWSVSRVAGEEQVHVHVHHGEFIDTGTRCRGVTRSAAR